MSRSEGGVSRRRRRTSGAHLKSLHRRAPGLATAARVVDFADRRDKLGVIAEADRLVVRFRDLRRSNGVDEIDLSDLLSRKALAYAVADFVLSWGAKKQASTRRNASKHFRSFWRYLDEREAAGDGAVASVGDLSTEIVNGYQAWLDRQAEPKRDEDNGGTDRRGKSDQTKAYRYGALRELIRWLKTTPAFRGHIDQSIRVKKNPWPARHRKGKPREVLSNDAIAAIRRACLAEIAGIVEVLERGRAILDDPEIVPPPVSSRMPAYKSFEACLKAVAEACPGPVLPREVLKRTHRGLAKAINHYHSHELLIRHLYLTPRTLVPFIVMFAMSTLFNPDTLLELTWERVKRSHPIFGEDRWQVRGEKRRAGRDQIRSFPARIEDFENPPTLLKILDRYGERLRPFADPRMANRVFLFNRRGASVPTGYEGRDGTSGAHIWRHARTAFIEDNDLPQFVLSSFRATGSDIIHELSGGDIKAQQRILGHRSAQTTQDHYQSDAARRRQDEALAEAMAWRERFIESGGRADTRNAISFGAKPAATPGFGCFEPYFSPQPGQQDGRMCSAYGSCPACPLSNVNVRDPAALIRLHQLHDRLTEARDRVAPERWLNELQPQLDKLTTVWLPRFPVETIDLAEALSLPPLPPIE